MFLGFGQHENFVYVYLLPPVLVLCRGRELHHHWQRYVTYVVASLLRTLRYRSQLQRYRYVLL